MKLYGKTDIGKKRTKNQDCFGFKELEGITVLVVCDGMGGARGGAIASKLALDGFLSICERDLVAGLDDRQIRNILSVAVAEANSSVFRKAAENSALSGMGTTLVAAVITEGSIFTVNVGDSRAYTLVGDSFEQVSHDHSYVQLLLDMGDITPEEAETHPDRNIITKAVGTSEFVKADIDVLESDRPSYILLCSDGLTGMVKKSDIEKIIVSNVDLKEKGDTLVDLANENGGNDNITVLMAEL